MARRCERQKAYATETQLGGKFVFDRDSTAVAAYKAPHTSYVVIVDKAGKVVYTAVGGDQDIGAATAKAFAPTAGRDHQGALDEAGSMHARDPAR